MESRNNRLQTVERKLSPERYFILHCPHCDDESIPHLVSLERRCCLDTDRVPGKWIPGDYLPKKPLHSSVSISRGYFCNIQKRERERRICWCHTPWDLVTLNKNEFVIKIKKVCLTFWQLSPEIAIQRDVSPAGSSEATFLEKSYLHNWFNRNTNAHSTAA